MTTDPKPRENRSGAGKRALHLVAALLIVALLSGGLVTLGGFGEGRPNFYHPARAPLISAKMILSEMFVEEEELGQKFQTLHTRLDSAIALLEKAERLDRQDKRQIEAALGRLQALADTERMATSDPKILQRAYRGLTKQLDTLANRLEQRPST